MSPIRKFATVCALLVTLSAAAQQRSRVLIPTLYTGGGAFGSSWWSRVVINNHAPVPFSSPGVLFLIECPIPEGCESENVPAGQFGEIIEPRAANGLLLHADAAVLENVAFSGRFGQGDQFRVTSGSELPIVREHAFRRSTIRFPFVTLHMTREPIRSTLRIYGPDAQPGTTVRVEIRPWHIPSGPAMASHVVTLDVPSQPADVPIFPAFGQVALQQQFPFERVGGAWFNISVVPLPLPSGEVPRIWAFISTTENITQQVTIQTPQ